MTQKLKYKMERVTQEIQNDYLKELNMCPFCKKIDNLKIGKTFAVFCRDEISRMVTCKSCKASWEEIFTLSSIYRYPVK